MADDAEQEIERASVIMALFALEEAARRAGAERDGYNAREVSEITDMSGHALDKNRCAELLAQLMGERVVTDASPDDYSLYKLEVGTRGQIIERMESDRKREEDAKQEVMDSVERLDF